MYRSYVLEMTLFLSFGLICSLYKTVTVKACSLVTPLLNTSNRKVPDFKIVTQRLPLS